MKCGWNSGPSSPAMACRQRDRVKENKKNGKREKREKHKSATVMHEKIKYCISTIPNIDQKHTATSY
jgi:hypothetical protein